MSDDQGKTDQPKYKIGRGRSTREQHLAALNETERAMVALRMAGPVIEHLTRKYGVHSRTAKAWMKEVRDRWAREGNDPDVAGKRKHEMRAVLEGILSGALNAVAVVRKNGEVVYDPASGRPLTRPAPDRDAALKACAQLRALDGLDTPQDRRLHVTADLALVDGRMAALEAAVRADPAKREALRLLLEAEDLADLVDADGRELQ